MKLSPWYEMGIKPFRTGVYQVDEHHPAYAYWNGDKFGFRRWVYIDGSKEEAIRKAFECRNDITRLPTLTTWRGIIK